MTDLVRPVLAGHRSLIVGVANEDSIAYGCARAFREAGAELAITWLNDKARPHVEPLATALGATITAPLDVGAEGELEAVFGLIRARWGRLDSLVHSIAFAPKEDLQRGLLDCSAAGFARAMDVSCHSFVRMARLAQKAGIPDGVINVVPGYGPTAGAAIVKHKGVDKVAFTGEYKTAQIIMRDAASTLKRLTFELGGKSPNIVFADSDLDAAAAGSHFGLYFNQGQCCCAGSRLFVEDKVYDKFVDKLAGMNRKHRLGNPLDPETEQGPQVDQAQFDKIMHYIDLGKKEGAQCVTGGKRHGDRGYFIEPTLFTGAKDEMSIAKDEIFGPVLSVFKFKDTDEVVDRGNKTFYGLAAAVWTRDIGRATTLATKLRWKMTKSTMIGRVTRVV